MQRNYHDLLCYQRSIELAAEVIKLSTSLRSYRLSEQLVASSLSIPSNIAEGAAYHSKKSYAHYLVIAGGSCAELETQLQVLKRVLPKQIEQFEILRLEAIAIHKMIGTLRSKVLRWQD